jgi:lariat debranching enzyme
VKTRTIHNGNCQIAVQGCCHGDLDAIYDHIQELELMNSYKVDALLICGDFQAVRNHQDLQCMAVPNKYKELKDFYKWGNQP